VTEVATVTVPAVTVNVAEVAPCGIVTLGGTLATARLELESDITAPPVGAAAVSVTVPVPVCPVTIVVGLTVTLLRVAVGVMVPLVVLVTPA
jgi:hypothetical protein